VESTPETTADGISFQKIASETVVFQPTFSTIGRRVLIRWIEMMRDNPFRIALQERIPVPTTHLLFHGWSVINRARKSERVPLSRTGRGIRQLARVSAFGDLISALFDSCISSNDKSTQLLIDRLRRRRRIRYCGIAIRAFGSPMRR
jgi:hypothetical protein